jgi:hypothetical protein
MSKQITLLVPEKLGEELENYQEQIVEILELGLQQVKSQDVQTYADEDVILTLLASQPDPKEILALRPSPELQARVNELIKRSKEKTLSDKEEAELQRYFSLEHLVRLAKAHASKQLKQRNKE